MYKLMIVLFSVLLATACQKTLRNVQDYFPVVKTVSATIQADGSVLVEGEIESEGAAPLEFIGFSCSTLADHPINERQMIVDTLIGNKFTVVYSGGFEDDQVYYFKAWATNSYGYSTGEVLPVQGIIGTPVVPPCSLSMNFASISNSTPSGTFSMVSAATEGLPGIWEITAKPYNGPGVNLVFGSKPTTAVYTTTYSTSPGPGQVFVSFYQDFIYDSLDEGASVYVNKIGAETYEINICDAPWVFNSAQFYLQCRFLSPS